MQDAYRHCEQLVRAADKDRFLATLFAPAEARPALHALYAFNLEIARVREAIRDPMAGEIRLQWWRDALAGEGRGAVTANPVAAAVLDTMTRHGLSAAPLLNLIEARSFDLYDDQMPTLAALEAYVRSTSSGLVAQAARVLAGDHPAIAEAALPAGLAYGITGLLRAVARHASRRQLYVPLEVLERHGARPDDIFAGNATAQARAALAEMRIRAGAHLAAFESAMPSLPAKAAPAFLPVALARGDLERMDRPGYDPFKTVVEAPQWRRQWVLWRAATRYSGLMIG